MSGIKPYSPFNKNGLSITPQNPGDALDATIIGSTTPAAGAFTQVKSAKGADVASANALTLGTDGNYFDITGVTTITSIGTLGIGIVVTLHFDGILTLTHHTDDLILPSAANITTAAGDEAIFVEYATGDWRCIGYQRAVRATAFSDIKQGATEVATGVLEKATTAEVVTGTDTDRAVTPAGVTARMAEPGAIGSTTPAAVTTSDLKVTNDAADATLSGTPKIFLIKDNAGTPHYFKAYPTIT